MERLSATSLLRAAAHLAARDKSLASIFVSLGPPPMWRRKTGFSTLIRIILEQQVSLASAASMFARLQSTIVPLSPENLLSMGEFRLRSLGLTRQKTTYFLDLADAMVHKRLNLRRLAQLPDQEARAALMQIKGIGSWTADIYLLMALRRPDIWPDSDLALIKAMNQLRQTTHPLTAREIAEIAEGWRPLRSIAARMLWQYYLAQRRVSEQNPSAHRTHRRPLSQGSRYSGETVGGL